MFKLPDSLNNPMVYIFDGKKEAGEIKASLKKKIFKLKKKPVLELVLVGDDSVNESYLTQLQKIALELEVRLSIHRFGNCVRWEKMAEYFTRKNNNEEIKGILVQISPSCSLFSKREEVINLLKPEKDSDFLGEIFFKDKNRLPSVCQAVLIAINKASEVLSFHSQWVNTLVIGNQGFWGRRIQQTLINQGFENVAGIDKETIDLKLACTEADIIISCTGQPGLIKRPMVKKGAVVIDVGVSIPEHRYNSGPRADRVIGDVDFRSVSRVAGFITPVPGGIGPLSTILAFKNLVGRN